MIKRASAPIPVLLAFLFMAGANPCLAQYGTGTYSCSFDATGYTAPTTNQSVNVSGIFSLTIGKDLSLSKSSATLSVNDGGAGPAVCGYEDGTGNIVNSSSSWGGLGMASLSYQASNSNSGLCPSGNATLTLTPVQNGLTFLYVNENGFFGNGSCGLADPPLSGSAFVCRYMIDNATGMGSGYGTVIIVPALNESATLRAAFGITVDNYPKGPGPCLYTAGTGAATYPLPGQLNQGSWQTNPKLEFGSANCPLNPPFSSVNFATTQDAIMITAPGISSPNCVRAGKGFLELSTTEIKFGPQKINSTTVKSITVKNTGTAPVTINEIDFNGAGAFTQSNDCIGSALAPKQPCTINASFKPTMKPAVTGMITIFSDASTAILSVSLAGSGR